MHQLFNLLTLKLILLKNGFRHLRRRSSIEFFTLILFLTATAVLLFFFFLQSFRFFEAQEPFGPILIDETFYLLTFAMFFMLLVSSSVSAYTSLFRSGEVPFLLSRPVEWTEIYFVKLAEAMWYSSWGFLFVAGPFMAAYGMIKQTGIAFPFLCLLFYLPLIVLAGTLGTLVSILLIWLLPSRRKRRLATLIALVLIAFFFLKTQPQIIKEQGSLAGVMSGYLPHVSFAKNPLLPSSWVTRGILSLASAEAWALEGWREGSFYFFLLLANMLFFLIPSYAAARSLYPQSYLRYGDHTESRTCRRFRVHQGLYRLIDSLRWPSQPVLAFLEKDLKVFRRDPAEWSQMIVFFGLLLLYFANLKNLEFHILKSFWKNLVFVLNTVGTYIVLSSFSMRFVFPMLSLEGSRFWVIHLSPVKYTQLLLEKFFLGTSLSLLLTLPLIFLSGWMLEISPSQIFFITGLGVFVCVALTGLSVGFGALFPNFKSTHPSEIISGLGGSLLLVAHLGYLGLIGAFLMLSKDPHWLNFCFVSAFSLLVGMIPLKLGIQALERMEF